MQLLRPTQKQNLRTNITWFLTQAEAHRLNWEYSQQRPFHGFGVPPAMAHIADCSSYCSLAFNWAMHKIKLYINDPLDHYYNGTGYTGSLLHYCIDHPVGNDKFLVGDFALFGPSLGDTHHVSICAKAGNTKTAGFSSNGHESWRFISDAPERITLAHEKAQQHLLGVYRHPQLI